MMKLMSIALASVLVTATSAYAGDFVNLRDDLAALSATNGGLVVGIQNPARDPLFLDATSYTWVDGYSTGYNDLVASSISYSSSSGNYELKLLDWQVTTNVPLLPGIAQATVYDFVYQDSRDGALVFGTRYINLVDNNQEVNFLYRYGFEGLETSAGWMFLSDFDLRLYEAGRTDDYSFDFTVGFDGDAVRQKSDISVSEGNPRSGLFLVKTDATEYTLADKAIGYYQAGEEGQAVVGGFIGGFVPTVAAVPEPSEYALMLLGLGVVGFVAGRRKKNLA
ncbi:PEP-CTERM sorting domain-containing protein [Methylobacillus sp. Pita1]|uniref:PEP-CTERM sorting domain-containing protein n=1 Tax=Methylobacillus sp. Pita1 TaxID=3382642 RepID=UPI0038B49526